MNEDDEDLGHALESALRADGPELDDGTIAAYVVGKLDDAGREAVLQALADSAALRSRVLSVAESIDQLRTSEGRARFDAAVVPPLPVIVRGAPTARAVGSRPWLAVAAAAVVVAALFTIPLLGDRSVIR